NNPPVTPSQHVQAFVRGELARQREELAKELESRLGIHLWTVQLILSALVGALTGTLLAGYSGTLAGLLGGSLVALIGRPLSSAIALAVPGALLGDSYLGSDGGAWLGLVLGAFFGACIGDIGSRSRLANWVRSLQDRRGRLTKR